MSQKSTNTQPRREEEYTEDSTEQTAVRAAPSGLSSESAPDAPEEFLDASSPDEAGFPDRAPAGAGPRAARDECTRSLSQASTGP